MFQFYDKFRSQWFFASLIVSLLQTKFADVPNARHDLSACVHFVKKQQFRQQSVLVSVKHL